MTSQFKFDVNEVAAAESPDGNAAAATAAGSKSQISLDTIAVNLLKHNFILTALELHTELAESGRELPRLRDFFSNPANFEQYSSSSHANTTLTASGNNFFPLHKTPSIQTFDSLDLTRYSDDISESNNKVEDKITLLEFELRKARETISQLRYTLTMTTENETLLTSPSPVADLSTTADFSVSHSQVLLPHEKNAVNFLVNEYLLLQNYKMTSVTFSEENESQDLEDWDVVGLNICKPPNLISLYKFYNQMSHQQSNDKREERNKPREQVVAVVTVDFSQCVNLDANLIESQSVENEKLIMKQTLLLNKIEQLQADIENLNSERELFIKKFESLTSHNAELKKKVHALEEQLSHNEKQDREASSSGENELHNSENKYEKFKFERKIPILFKESLAQLTTMKLSEENELVLKEIHAVNSNYDDLVRFVAKFLPNVVPNVSLQKRVDLIPLIVYSAILQQTPNERDSLLRLLFNLFKKPDQEQRAMILAGCACFAKQAGPDRANNELLPQCWEQISSKYEEIRCMVAESCAVFAPYIPVDIRGSLILSIIKQIILQDKSDEVRVNATRSLGVLINYIQDEEKFPQCIELLDYCLSDNFDIQTNANQVVVPSLALWSLELDQLTDPLMSHFMKYIEKLMNNENQKQNESFYLKAKTYVNLFRNLLQYLYAYVLNKLNADSPLNVSPTKASAPINGTSPSVTRSYSKYAVNSKKAKSQSGISDLYSLDAIIEKSNVDSLKAAFQLKINNGSVFGELPVLEWIEKDFLKKFVAFSAQIDAQNSLTCDLIEFFAQVTETFGVDYAKIKVLPLFDEFIKHMEAPANTPKYATKAILSVYFVGVLSTCYHSGTTDDKYEEFDAKTNENFEFLNDYMKNLLIEFSLKEIDITTLNVIYDQLSKTSKSFHLQVLLSTLWEGIVHVSANVRCYTARLFEVLVKNVDDTLLSNRVLPALITLANDPERTVRCASISPLSSVIENYANKEILERVYAQIQSFLNDPNLKDDYEIKTELIKAFKRIVVKTDSKFREEFLLPYLTILTMQTIQAQHALLSLHENKSQEITCLLFDVYNSISSCSISRQSIQESLLPGLSCLKQILHENQILYGDKLKTVDALISDFESKLQLLPAPQQQQHQQHLNNSNGTSDASPSTLESNFKQIMFKGFSNSKDKFSNFLSTRKQH